VQHGVAGTVRSCACALHRFLTVIGGVATKGTLVNRAIGIAVKRHSHMLKFIHHFGRFTAHVFDRVLVAQPVRTFDGVIKVEMPVVFRHIAQRSTDAALGSNRV
jgi:hypothetical protein